MLGIFDTLKPIQGARQPRVLLVGGGGALGSAVLEQLVADSYWGAVGVLVDEHLNTTLPGLLAVRSKPGGRPEQHDATGFDSVVLVFDRERHANGRDRAFVRVDPADLVALAQAWAAAGVQNLSIVTPQSPAGMPEALRHGLANLDEQAVSAMDFAQVLWLRPSQTVARVKVGSWLQRLAHGVLASLSYMAPERDKPIRLVKLAQLVRMLTCKLADIPPGRRVVPFELVWTVSTAPDGPAANRVVMDWLLHGHVPDVRSVVGRM